MKIVDRLDKEQVSKLDHMRKNKLSNRELKDLMGVNRDTYKRVNGKWRRR